MMGRWEIVAGNKCGCDTPPHLHLICMRQVVGRAPDSSLVHYIIAQSGVIEKQRERGEVMAAPSVAATRH